MKKELLTTFLVGTSLVSGLAFGTTIAKADTTGVVTTLKMSYLYTDKGKLITDRALAANTPWATGKQIDLPNLGKLYQVATNEYVKTSDVKVQSNDSNIDTSVENTGTAEISYAPSEGTDLWQGYGNNKTATGRKLTNGTAWKFFQKVVDKNGDAWYEIGNDQWISGAFAKISNSHFTEAAAQVWDPNYAALKVNRDVALYNDSNFSAIGNSNIGAGAIVEVTSTVLTGDTIWYELSNGGWLPSSVVTPINVTRPQVSLNGKTREQVINDVINAAKQQLGKPYVWNGKGPDNFDCSGLMQYVFRQATGQNIGSWTVPQESAGSRVSINQLQAGDLVFWGTPGASYHVGLYLGNNQYLNALRPGTNVKIDSISSSFEPSFGVRIFK